MVALEPNVLIYACDKADPSRQQVALDLASTADDYDRRRIESPGGLSGGLSARRAKCQGAGTSPRSPRGRGMVVPGRDDRCGLPGMRRFTTLLGRSSRPRSSRPD